MFLLMEPYGNVYVTQYWPVSGDHCHITFELTIIRYTRPIAAHTDKHFQPGTQRRGEREAKCPGSRVTWGR